MKLNFDVNILSIGEIHALPNLWSYDDYRNILKLVDFEYRYGLNESELKKYTLLALQDFEPDEAAEIVWHFTSESVEDKVTFRSFPRVTSFTT